MRIAASLEVRSAGGTIAPIGLVFLSRLSRSKITPSARLCVTIVSSCVIRRSTTFAHAATIAGPPWTSRIVSVAATPRRASRTSMRYGRSFTASFQSPSPGFVSIVSSTYLKAGANAAFG